LFCIIFYVVTLQEGSLYSRHALLVYSENHYL
jgi:hypothetical protein